MARGESTPLDKENKNIVSNNLIEIARSKNLRQADIVRLSGLAKSTINGYFKGISLPTETNLLKLSKALNVSPADIDPRYSNSKPTNKYSDADLDEMIDNAHSYDGKPVDDHDRALIRQYLKALFSNK